MAEVGEILSVKGVKLKIIEKSGNKLTLSCFTCSKDTLLYPLGSFKSTLPQLVSSEAIPCNCTGQYKHNKRQLHIITERLCENYGLKLVGFDSNGTVIGTQAIVRNRNYPYNYSSSVRLTTFKKTNRLCVDKYNTWECTASVYEIPARVFGHGERYLSKDVTGTRGWQLRCNICAKDKYSREGLCNGMFKTNIKSLRKGYLPCRCNERPRLTKDQIRFNVQTILESEGCMWKGYTYSEGNSTQKWRFSWECHCGVVNKNVLISNYLNNERRCSSCAKSGFDRTKPTFFYIVRWYSEYFSCIKFGITNRKTVKSRVLQQNSKTALKYEVINFYRFDSGDWPLSVETYLKRECKDIKYCPKYLLPQGWCETIKDTIDNIDFIENLILQGK